MHGSTIPAESLAIQIIWKNAELLNAAKGIVLAALTRKYAGIPWMCTDHVAPEYRPSDSKLSPGIMGSACCTLKAAGILADGPDRVRSDRPEANGRKIGTYRLVSVPLSESFLSRYGIHVEKQQMELALR
jgi:hypothetical protein